MSHFIVLANPSLAIVQNFKDLGVYLDTHLTFEEHIQRLIKDLEKKMYVRNQIRPYLTLSVSSTYFHAVILWKMSHCLPIWSRTTSELTEPTARFYNRAYKIHLKLSPWTHHCVVHSQSKLLNFHNYTVLSSINLFYQLYYHHLPSSLCSVLPRHNSIRLGRITRAITNEPNTCF